MKKLLLFTAFFGFVASTAFAVDEAALYKLASSIKIGEYEKVPVLYNTIFYDGIPVREREFVISAFEQAIESQKNEVYRQHAALGLDLLMMSDDKLRLHVLNFFKEKISFSNNVYRNCNEDLAARLAAVRNPDKELVALALGIARQGGDKKSATLMFGALVKWASENKQMRVGIIKERDSLLSACADMVDYWKARKKQKDGEVYLTRVIESRDAILKWDTEAAEAESTQQVSSELEQLGRTALLEKLRDPATVLETAQSLVAIEDLPEEFLIELRKARRHLVSQEPLVEAIDERLRAHIAKVWGTDPLSACFILIEQAKNVVTNLGAAQ